MLPTFVIGLREGLEASLIVGIVAAFLRQRGRFDLLRWVFVGVLSAVTLCAAAGVTLEILSRDLPQRQQEGLETVIGTVAVAMVTYMVVWMKRHSRDLKGQLDRAAGSALATGSAYALVLMAFLAVLREGLETVVFLLAAFNETGSGGAAALGAALGIATAIGLGYAIYRGGVRINLSRFFRITGVVLVLVAGGLVVSALHTAHEAGWLNFGQQQTVNLSSIVEPGTVRASLLTGMLGFQPEPVLIEVVGWLLYVVPVGLYVAWPPGRVPRRRTIRKVTLVAGSVAAVLAIGLAILAPSAPTAPRVLQAGTTTAALVDVGAGSVTMRISHGSGATGDIGPITLHKIGRTTVQGTAVTTYRGSAAAIRTARTMTAAEVARANGGRLPLGAQSADGTPLRGSAPVRVIRTTVETITAWIADDTDRIVDLRTTRRATVAGRFASGTLALAAPAAIVSQIPPATAAAQAAAARQDSATLDQRRAMVNLSVVLAVAAIAMLATGGWLTLRRRSRPDPVAAAVAAAGIPPGERHPENVG